MTDENHIPHGYCHCGCGQKTRLARQTRPQYGQVQGQPQRYIHNHHLSGGRWAGGTPEERFHGRYAKAANGCWEWQGSLSRSGYGALGVDGKLVGAHRYAYELLVGPIPDSLVIDHLCRNRACVNPAHLEPVTQEENIRRGGLAVLRPEQVNEVRRAVDELCEKYGIGPQALADIGKRYTWASVPEEPGGPGPRYTVQRKYA